MPRARAYVAVGLSRLDACCYAGEPENWSARGVVVAIIAPCCSAAARNRCVGARVLYLVECLSLDDALARAIPYDLAVAG